MAIKNVERIIRFSRGTLSYADANITESGYTHGVLPVLMESTDFVAALESKENHVMTQKQMQIEANRLALSNEPVIADFGKAAQEFLAKGVQGFDKLLITISAVVLAGGLILSTCITLIVALILYAVTILPAAAIIAALSTQYKSMERHLEISNDVNVKKYKSLSRNIIGQEKGVRDINELSKMVNITECIYDVRMADAECPHENEKVHDYCTIMQAIDHNLNNRCCEENEINAMEMEMLGGLAPSDRVYQMSVDKPLLESVDFGMDGTPAFMTLESIIKQPMLSTEGLYHGITCIVSDIADKRTILEFFQCYKNTAKYEFTHENYSDIPLLKATGLVLGIMENQSEGNGEMMENVKMLNNVLGHTIDEAYTEVLKEAEDGGPCVTTAVPSTTEVGFNPDPYNIGSLTPFPVACRKVSAALCDINRAETDEELTEAMLQFGRVSTILEENYDVMGNDDMGYMIVESEAGKVARRASDKASQAFSKSATKDKTEGVVQAVKRTIDPMEKFIQKQYEILREKDANERRNIILKGGAAPKVMRWIKRGIGLLIGAGVGALIPAAAIVTGITFIGFVATDKYLDTKERTKLLQELEDEIQICNEKIDDSRGDDNKQKKYELMRIRNQLTRTSEKIRLGLKY